ncbi:NfeD family protein [Aporhodopirellula aestuarii]|uniref:Nodulation protein NfeD n=1 Tax=Aporhodopirellula aestuarii TaxID=2950107 RepID=A0ABT0U524_9BACT|nr:NfeD family protein [Aporhodopirellula aestuarii]MCM2371955.1 nodulation protein NfeD [Aporhodopirellula aestuarii]
MPAFYAIALLIAFYALVAAEVLIPSGGILGLAAAVVAVTSIIIGTTYSVSMGMTLLLIYLITTPVLFVVIIRLWPKTRIGRKMLNRDTLQSDTTLPPPTTLDGTPLDELVGRVGIAVSNLLPSGQVKVDGHKTDAVSTGLPIDAQSRVMVVRVYGGKLQVRAAHPDEIEAERARVRTDTNAIEVPVSVVEPLSDRSPATGTSEATTSVVSPLDDVDFEVLEIETQPENTHGRSEAN